LKYTKIPIATIATIAVEPIYIRDFLILSSDFMFSDIFSGLQVYRAEALNLI
jgi:hypothetical protein